MDNMNNFTFEKLKARLPIFKNNLVVAVQSLQREDFFGIKAQIALIDKNLMFDLIKRSNLDHSFYANYVDLYEALGSDLVLAYKFYFSELSSQDISLLKKILFRIEARHMFVFS